MKTLIINNFCNCQLHRSLMRSIAYHNEPTLWDSNVNATEEKELAWFRLSSTFSTPAGLTSLMSINHRCKCNKLYCPVLTLIRTLLQTFLNLVVSSSRRSLIKLLYVPYCGWTRKYLLLIQSLCFLSFDRDFCS